MSFILHLKEELLIPEGKLCLPDRTSHIQMNHMQRQAPFADHQHTVILSRERQER